MNGCVSLNVCHLILSRLSLANLKVTGTSSNELHSLPREKTEDHVRLELFDPKGGSVQKQRTLASWAGLCVHSAVTAEVIKPMTEQFSVPSRWKPETGFFLRHHLQGPLSLSGTEKWTAYKYYFAKTQNSLIIHSECCKVHTQHGASILAGSPAVPGCFTVRPGLDCTRPGSCLTLEPSFSWLIYVTGEKTEILKALNQWLVLFNSEVGSLITSTLTGFQVDSSRSAGFADSSGR